MVSDFAELRNALVPARFNVLMLEYAVQNIDGVAARHESEIVRYLAMFERVCAVWLDDSHIFIRCIKGSDSDGRTAMTNAIAVRDETDARRWGAMLNTPAADAPPPTTRSLRLATVNGAALISEMKV